MEARERHLPAALHWPQPRRPLAGLAVLVGGRQAQGIVEGRHGRSEEHTSELQSLMRISYAVFCLKKKIHKKMKHTRNAKQPIITTYITSKTTNTLIMPR